MWSNLAKPLTITSIMLTACATPVAGSGATTGHTRAGDLWMKPSLPSREATAFEVADTVESGWFSGYLRNDEHLFTSDLFQRFRALAQAFCGAKALIVDDGDRVVITADQRRPDPFFQTNFRCEAARP